MKTLLVVIATFAVAAFLLRSDGWKPEGASAANYASVSTGGQHTCALTSGGGVQCWGRGAEGQLGDGSLSQEGRPVAVSGLSSGVTSISVGERHSCALLTGGTVKCWGRNFNGNLGDGTTTSRSTPVDVCASGSGSGCPALSGILAIAAGNDHVCALTSGGGAKCWGWNHHGQLGNGTTTSSPLPVDVAGLTSGAAGVAVGQDHSCAVTSGGGVKCWGTAGFGVLGSGAIEDQLSPVDVTGLSSGVSAIELGAVHSCALLASQTMKCWGSGGSLGNNSTADEPFPVDVCAPGGPSDPCGTLTDVLKFSAGGGHTCAYTSSSTTYCWGWDGWGQLSDGSGGFLDFTTRPAQVAGMSDILSLSAGTGSTCVVFDPVGATNCWGWNSDGQLGDGTMTDRASWQSIQDFDSDGCADYRELQSAPGSETSGGLRNAKNPHDYFNPSGDGENRVDDILLVVQAYFNDDDDGNPGLPPYEPGYDPDMDRSNLAGSPNPWNTGAPDGLQRVQDILHAINSYFHDCS